MGTGGEARGWEGREGGKGRECMGKGYGDGRGREQ